MKKILFFILPIIALFFLTSVVSVSAATCEYKEVCIDNSHVGIRGTDCVIRSADEVGSAFGVAGSSYSCYVGCKDGACIKDNTPSTCVDTDGGVNFFVKGDVSTKGNGVQATGADSCLDKATLNETSCSKDASEKYSIQISPYKCPNGCVNGACINTSAGSPGSTVVSSPVDADGDGLSNADEARWGTDPKKFDTDGDGYGDMTEIASGYNPLGAGKLTPEQVALATEMTNSNVSLSAPTSDVTATDAMISSTTDTEESQFSSTTMPGTFFDDREISPIMPSGFPADLPIYFLVAYIAVIAFVYIFSSLCLHLIARKLSISWAWAAWIPVASSFLMIRCAGKPLWWFILLLIPIVNIAIGIILLMNMAGNLGKSKVLGVLMIIPIVNLFIMGYLAFSKSSASGNGQNNFTAPPTFQPPAMQPPMQQF